MIRVEGHKNLFRDEKTGAILNCDTNSYQKYIKMKNEKKKQKDEIEDLKNSTNDLKKELSEIKSLLMEIVNGSK
jgi:uncharacterized Zn finger protein (UPF0148 family)